MYSQNLHLDRIQRAVLDGAVVFCAALAATWMRHDLAWIGGYTVAAVVAAIVTFRRRMLE